MANLRIGVTQEGKIVFFFVGSRGEQIIQFSEEEWASIMRDSVTLLNRAREHVDKLKISGDIEDPFFMEV